MNLNLAVHKRQFCDNIREVHLNFFVSGRSVYPCHLPEVVWKGSLHQNSSQPLPSPLPVVSLFQFSYSEASIRYYLNIWFQELQIFQVLIFVFQRNIKMSKQALVCRMCWDAAWCTLDRQLQKDICSENSPPPSLMWAEPRGKIGARFEGRTCAEGIPVLECQCHVGYRL